MGRAADIMRQRTNLEAATELAYWTHVQSVLETGPGLGIDVPFQIKVRVDNEHEFAGSRLARMYGLSWARNKDEVMTLALSLVPNQEEKD